jgi:hypothetical protein
VAATVSSLTITIDAATDVVMSASPASPTSIGITAYSQPVILTSVGYAPSSPYLNGSTALSKRREQSLLNFTVAPFGAASEAAAKTLIDALRAAVEQFSFNTTVVENGVTYVWRCDSGSVTPAVARSRINLDRPHILEWNVSIPCYPVAS